MEKSGVAVCEGSKVVEVIEKPQQPPSNNIIVGIYFMQPSVFDVIRNVKPSARGETEITEVQRHYLEKGKLSAAELKGNWLDAGDFEDLLNANLETKKLVDNKK